MDPKIQKHVEDIEEDCFSIFKVKFGQYSELIWDHIKKGSSRQRGEEFWVPESRSRNA